MKKKIVDIGVEGNTIEDYDKINAMIGRVELIKTTTFNYFILTNKTFNEHLSNTKGIENRVWWMDTNNFSTEYSKRDDVTSVVRINVSMYTEDMIVKIIVDTVTGKYKPYRNYFVSFNKQEGLSEFSGVSTILHCIYLYTYMYIHMVSFPLRWITKRNEDEIVGSYLTAKHISYSVYNTSSSPYIPIFGQVYRDICKMFGFCNNVLHNSLYTGSVYQYSVLSTKHFLLCCLHVHVCLYMMSHSVSRLFAYFAGFHYIFNLYLFYKVVKMVGIRKNAAMLSVVVFLYCTMSFFSPVIVPLFFVIFFVHCCKPHLFGLKDSHKKLLLIKLCFFYSCHSFSCTFHL